MDTRNLAKATRRQFATTNSGTGTQTHSLRRNRCQWSAKLDPPPQLAGLRIALVHDWLTGMRGGEKCLEVLCSAFPEATLYTLIHRRGSLSPAIESMKIRTSPLQKFPGSSSLSPPAADHAPGRARLAAQGRRPRHQPEPLRGQGRSCRRPGVPHVCYCFTPMRYAWQGRETYLESWSDRPVRGHSPGGCSRASGAGTWRRPAA